MSVHWKTVRVFISSTFRDMQAERDHLVKLVFPALREELEKHRVHLVDIDLRWGVTKEQADNDEALDVCLDQIDTCRPFFLGILGDRYGYVSSKLPERVASKYGWIRHHSGKSITELEILYGVLNSPQMHSRALFLFRDNGFLTDVPSDKRQDLEGEDNTSGAKLAKLKQAIRDAGLPALPYSCKYGGLKKNGEVQLTGLEAFGRQIAAWLGSAIKAELKLGDQPPTGEADPLAEESDFHERFMESRLRVYVGREQINDSLTAFVEGNEPGACLVTGPSGSGKSAALARFVTDYRQKHPQTLVLPHFIGASPASMNPGQMLQHFCLLLKNEFGFAEDVPQDFNELTTLFRAFLNRIPAERKTVLVLDALNQLNETDNAQSLYWLPRELPGHVKVIASCSDDGDQSGGRWEREKQTDCLQVLRRRDLREVKVGDLSPTEQRQIIRAVPSLSAKTLDAVQVGLLLSNRATSNPLFLLVTLEELRGFGSFEQLDRRIVEFPHAVEQEPGWHNWLNRAKQSASTIPDGQKRQAQLKRLEQVESALRAIVPVDDTLTAVFLQVIDRLESDFNPQVSQLMFALLASARAGLSERELQELLAQLFPDQAGQHRDEMQGLLRQVRSYLMRKGPLLDFYHRSFGSAVRAKYLASEAARRDAHLSLAGYFEHQTVALRKTYELPWQLREAGEEDRLREHLLDIPLFLAIRERDQSELMGYWVWLKQERAMGQLYLNSFERWATETTDATAVADTANATFVFLHHASLLAEAELLVQRALTIDEGRFGSSHPNIARDLNNLALLLIGNNRLDEAEPYCRRALRIFEQSYPGEDHPPIATSCNNLGLLLQATERQSEAELLFRRALAIWENTLGPEHANVAIALNNLARLLSETNRFAEAEPLALRALAIDERRLGQEHPHVANGLDNLAKVLEATGRLAQCEMLYRRALAIREKRFGHEHPDVGDSLNNIASVLTNTNRMSEAEPLLRRALALAERSLGPEDSQVAITLNNLATCLYAMNRMMQAELLARRALAILEKCFGQEHSKIAQVLNNLAKLLEATNRHAEAEPHYRRALAIAERTVGPEHPQVATALNNLAGLLRATSRSAEAEPLYRRAVMIFERSFGAEHRHVATSLNNLGVLLRNTNRLSESESLLRRALAIDVKNLGPEHPNVARGLSNLGGLLRATNRLIEAEEHYHRALAIYERSLGPDHPDVASINNNLASLLEGWNRLEIAEPLLRRAVEILVNFGRTSGYAHPHLQNFVNNYGRLLRKMGRTEGQVVSIIRQLAPECVAE